MNDPDGYFTGPDDPYHGQGFRQVTALPQWRVLLHDDEVHDQGHMIDALTGHTPLSRAAATQRVVDAHRDGTVNLLTCHQELAELYCLQLSKQNLIVTIERAVE